MQPKQESADIAEQIEELSRPRFAIFCAYLALDWLGIAVGFALFAWYSSLAGFLAASVVLGVSQHGLVVLGHEAVHFRVCRRRLINEGVGRLLCMFPVTLTVSSYREFHLPHHRDPFGPGDPELPLRRALGANFQPPFTIARGMRLWALSFLGFSIKELVIFGAMMPLGSIREKLWLAAYWGAVLAGAYFSGTLAFAALWGFALCTTYFSMLRIQGWYEHGLTDMSTNRYSLPSPLYRLILPLNIWVHYEHHKYPTVPFYNLEKERMIDHSDRIYQFDEMINAMANINLGEEPAKKAA